MRYIFIDLGAYDGDSIEEFIQGKEFTANGFDYVLPVEPTEFDIFAFEPNPRFNRKLHDMKKLYPNIKMTSQEVAWIAGGKQEFTFDTNDLAYGSTIMKSKRNWGVGRVDSVNTFDFSEWLTQFEGSYIIVKMDIEGAEFPILEKMIQDGTDLLVSQLWVEFHPNKVRDYTTTDMTNLIKRLRCTVKEWH